MTLSEQDQSTPEQAQARKLIFFSGNTMKETSNEPIKQEWLRATQQADSKDAAIFYPSITTEPLWADRFDTMAADIEAAITNKQEVTIVIYSLGAAEFMAAFMHFLDKRQQKRRENRDPFVPLDFSHIDLVLRSPAGLVKNVTDEWRQANRLVDLLKNSVGGPLVQLENLLTFHPLTEGGQADLATIIAAFNLAYPEFSLAQQHPETTEKLDTIPLQTGPNHLEDAPFADLKTDTLRQLDQKVLAAARNVQADPEAFRKALTERTQYLAQHKQKVDGPLPLTPMDQFFHNRDGVLTGEQWKPTELRHNLVAGLLGMKRVFGRTVCRGNHEVYKWFESRGMKITVVIPEHDRFVSLDDIQQFFDLTPEDILTPASTHNTLTNRPSEFVATLLKIGQRSKSVAPSAVENTVE
jgi:hypothetical protein